MKSRSLFCAALAVLLLLLSACGHPAPEASGAAAEGLSATDTITPEEGVAILEKQLGAVDEATGNVMSYGYEGPLTLDGVDDLPLTQLILPWSHSIGTGKSGSWGL